MGFLDGCGWLASLATNNLDAPARGHRPHPVNVDVRVTQLPVGNFAIDSYHLCTSPCLLCNQLDQPSVHCGVPVAQAVTLYDRTFASGIQHMTSVQPALREELSGEHNVSSFTYLEQVRKFVQTAVVPILPHFS